MFINAVSLSRKNFLVINVQVLIKRFRKNYWLSLRNSHCVTFYCVKLAVTGICSLRGRRFKREGKGSFGKGSFRRERNARGARGSFSRKLPFPSLSNACHAGYGICFATCEGQSCRLFVFVCRPLFSLFNSMNAQTVDEEERKKWTNSYPELSHSSFPVWVEKIERRWIVSPFILLLEVLIACVKTQARLTLPLKRVFSTCTARWK